jgi:hypothetical protein
MNKLKTTDNGGHPFELDDIRFMDEAYRDGLKGVLSAFGALAITDGFKISGCGVTVGGGNYTWTDGYIALNGEVLKVDAGSVPYPAGGNILTWDVVSTFDAAGLEQFEDGVSRDTYEVRKGALIEVPTTPTYMSFDALSLKDIVFDWIISDNVIGGLNTFVIQAISAQGIYALIAQEAWSYIDAPGKPAFENSWVNALGVTRKAAYRKNTIGMVSLSGIVANIGYPGSGSAVIFTLPVGYRPTEARIFACSNSTNDLKAITVNSNGQVSIQSSLSGDQYVDLNGIHFYIT